MNRNQRRRAEKKGQRDAFDEMHHWKFTYDLRIPPHALRGPHPGRVAGTIEARDEADLLRGFIVALMNAAGFSADNRAVIGTLAETINPFSKQMRGMLAYALVEGQGLAFDEDEIEVCKECGAGCERTIHPDPEFAPEECYDDPNCVNWGHHSPEPNCDCVPMIESTKHEAKCSSNEPDAVPVYTTTTGIIILMPRKYEPLNSPEDEAVANHVAEVAAALDEGATIPSDEGELIQDGEAEVANGRERDDDGRGNDSTDSTDSDAPSV